MDSRSKSKRGCTGTQVSRQVWWVKTLILRLRRAQEFVRSQKTEPTLAQLECEHRQLKAMLLLNKVLRDLVTRLQTKTRGAEKEKIEFDFDEIHTIARQANMFKSPFQKSDQMQ
jgi:hypothetical protein